MNSDLIASIIVLNYNGNSFVEDCIESLTKTEVPENKEFEIIFVDNGSTDGSADLIESKYGGLSNFKVFRIANNIFPPNAMNKGARQVKGKYFAFVPNDIKVESNWLMEIINEMERDDKIGVCQPKMLIWGDETKFESALHYIDYLAMESDSVVDVYGKKDTGQFDEITEIFYARALQVIRRDAFEKIEGFDNDYWYGFDDVDISWRVRLLGYRVLYVPKSVVFHKGGRLFMRERPPDIVYDIRRLHIAVMTKNYEFINILKYLPIYLFMVIGHSSYLLLKGDRKLSFAGLKGIYWAIKNVNYLLKRRKEVQKIRRVSDTEIKKAMTKPRINIKLL